ncbi:methyltransferase domain-containing protein [Trichothermofontia sp.]
MTEDKSIRSFYEENYQHYGSECIGNFHNYERNRVLTKIYSNGQGKRILDLGAGNGLVSRFFLDLGYEVYAIEWTTAGVNSLVNLGIKATQKDLEEVPYDYPDNFFDEVFWGDNIEHLFFPERVAREIYRILKPNGRLVLSTPNHGWIINRLYYLIMGVPRRTEGQRLPIWEWEHIRYFNKKEIFAFLKYCGFTKEYRFYAAERRQPFAFLATYFPAWLGSVMIVTARK